VLDTLPLQLLTLGNTLESICLHTVLLQLYYTHTYMYAHTCTGWTHNGAWTHEINMFSEQTYRHTNAARLAGR